MPTPGDLPSAVEEWTAQDVGIFMKTLGKDQRWAGYASTCVEMGIDGATLVDATVEILVELGFYKIHANKVLKEIAKRLQPAATTGGHHSLITSCLPLTETESEHMHLFGDYYNFMIQCETRILEAMDRLNKLKKAEIVRTKQQFEKIREKVVSERTRCLAEIEARHSTLAKCLRQELNRVKGNVSDSKETERILHSSMRIREWSQQPERTRTIKRATESILGKEQPFLIKDALFGVSYLEGFKKALEGDFFTVRHSEPLFENKALRSEKKTTYSTKTEGQSEHVELKIRKRAWKLFPGRTKSKRHYLGLARSPDGKYLFAVGGRDDNGKSLGTAETFCFATGEWTCFPAKMLTKRHGLGVAVSSDGKKLYAVGGYDGSQYLNSVEFYDFDDKTWTRLPQNMKVRRCGLGVALSPDGTKLYAIGGHDGSTCLDSSEYYDFATSKWTPILHPSHYKRHGLGVSMAPDGKRIYAIGGHDGANYLDSVEFYDIVTRRWNLFPNTMNKKRYGLGACISPDGRRLYVVGGHDVDGALRDVEIYDLSMGLVSKWLPLGQKMKNKRCGLGVALSPNGRALYAVGGGASASRIRTGNCNTAEFLDLLDD
uniref:SAM domain-containing protein n=1 Tax=Lotharella globosa TaxID=91324 RepID=A0A7S3Z9F3_9EUKA|mmetsp:Transcript_20965/g.42217  ORF Transcript_20965/g.42217 Transcript_20965/m.42217 type:complete len:601 (+) Transcript_20965:67-1869(+)